MDIPKLLFCSGCKSNKPAQQLIGFMSCESCRKYNRRVQSNRIYIFKVVASSQNNKCAICSEDIPIDYQSRTGGRFVIDHNHKTGKVRGILCNSCNIALGHFKDNTGLLYTAIKYLRNEGQHRFLMKLILGKVA